MIGIERQVNKHLHKWLSMRLVIAADLRAFWFRVEMPDDIWTPPDDTWLKAAVAYSHLRCNFWVYFISFQLYFHQLRRFSPKDQTSGHSYYPNVNNR